MKRNIAGNAIALACAILFCQSLLILAMSAGWQITRGTLAAQAALYGGACYWIPQLLFSVVTLKRELKTVSAGWVLWDFCVGTGVKFISTVAMFVTVLRHVEVDPVPLLVTYGLSFVCQWVITFVLNNRY
ncbi:MAG: ATP synthase subunit I [Aeromonas sp.]